MTPSRAEAALAQFLWSSCFQWEVGVEIIRVSWSSACMSLIYQTYQWKVFMGFCSCPWGVKVSETPCWWKKAGCAGRNLYPDLVQMWKPQLFTWLGMLGWDFCFLDLPQDLLVFPGQSMGVRAKQTYAWRVRKVRKDRRTYTGISFRHHPRIPEQSASAVKLASVVWSCLAHGQSSIDSFYCDNVFHNSPTLSYFIVCQKWRSLSGLPDAVEQKILYGKLCTAAFSFTHTLFSLIFKLP